MKSDDRRGTAAKKPGGLRPTVSVKMLVIAAAIFGLTTGSQGAVTIPAPAWLEKTAVADKMVINGASFRSGAKA